MWFITGIVMLYQHYPHFTKKSRLKHTPVLSVKEMPSVDSITKLAFENGIDTSRYFSLTLDNSLIGQSYFIAENDEKSVSFSANGDTLPPTKVDRNYLDKIAARWNEKIESIDTIVDLDQWTPFSRLRASLPFYRLNLSGDEGRQLYVASSDGKILNEHTRKQRFLAWAGAIPHWIYFTKLRQDIDLWSRVVIILSALGCFMVLTGIYVGVEVYLKRRKKTGKLDSPYKKLRYRWHHILGTVGGIFIFAWIFSGMMSLVNLPEWATGVPADRDRFEAVSHNITASNNHIDYRTLPIKEINGKSIKWTSFGKIPVITVITPEKTIAYDCSSGVVKELNITETDIQETVEQSLKAKPEKIELMNDYDSDYMASRKKEIPLPVYKVTMGDKYNTVIYINPKTGDSKLCDRSTRMYNLVYKKPHSLMFNCLTTRPWLWMITMWTLLLCGVVVSITGIWISYDYLKRTFKKKKASKEKA